MGFGDFAHRAKNDVNAAMAKAGFHIFAQAAILVFNVGYGPWTSAAFFNQILTHVQMNIGRSQVDGNTILHFWRGILRDRCLLHETDPMLVGRPARADVISKLASRVLLLITNDKCSAKSFFSLNLAAKAWQPVFTELAVCIASLCITKGYVAHQTSITVELFCIVTT